MSQPTDPACVSELPAFCQQRHWSIYWIFIVCSLAMVCGKIATVQNFHSSKETPFFSANDRSRWATVRALGDDNVFEIDDVIVRGQAVDWDTIDKVQHVGRDGQMHAYSSKPPLLPTLVAYLYKAVNFFTGKTITEDTFLVTRVLLLIVNALPWGLFLYFLAKTIDCIAVRDWSRYFVLGCAGFGTFLTTFSVTLNNHLPAAVATMACVYALLRISRGQETRLPKANWFTFLLAGFSAAFACANELPALSLLAIAFLVCLIQSPPKTMTAFVPAALLVVAGFFGTNYWAHQTLVPAYAHRSDGSTVATIQTDQPIADIGQLDNGKLPESIKNKLPESYRYTATEVVSGDWSSTPKGTKRWQIRDRVSNKQFVIAKNESSEDFQIRQRGNWYEYPGSYWLASNEANRSEVDRGEPDQLAYTFHCLIGHHGIVSLTPIWILSLAGMISLCFAAHLKLRWFGVASIAITVAVLAFYITRPEIDRNYGGQSSGLRWTFWLIPIWLVCMLPIADWLGQSKTGRFFCLMLLAISVVSAGLSHLNPWVHPWIYEIWQTANQ